MPSTAPGRLRKGAQFDTAFEQGTAFSGPLFVVRVRANGAGVLRVGYAVRKRLLPHATGRNRVRRRLRAATRAAGLPAGFDVVIVARGGAITASFEQLVSGVQAGFARAVRKAAG